MHITVIGVGRIGSTLAERLTASGHQVTIANTHDPESLADLAKRIGARAAADPAETSAWRADKRCATR